MLIETITVDKYWDKGPGGTQKPKYSSIKHNLVHGPHPRTLAKPSQGCGTWPGSHHEKQTSTRLIHYYIGQQTKTWRWDIAMYFILNKTSTWLKPWYIGQAKSRGWDILREKWEYWNCLPTGQTGSKACSQLLVNSGSLESAHCTYQPILAMYQALACT